jgi:curli biogenesis system outer membrane secretion channel CsgG
MLTHHARNLLGRAALLLVLAAALAALAPAALAATRAAAEAPQMQIGPPTVHVKNGKITVKAVCPPEASACEGVILGRLPLTRKPGSLLDPGSLGGPFFSMKPGETMGVVFRLTPKTKAYLKTHFKTTLNLTVKVLDDEGDESVSKLKLTLFAR